MIPLAGLSLLAALAQPTVAPPTPTAAHVHHALQVRLEPASHRLSVVDELSVPDGKAQAAAGTRVVEFVLNAALEVDSSQPGVTEVPLAPAPDEPKLKRYRAVLPPGGRLRVSYGGAFDFGLSEQKEEYTRGFRETEGVVSAQGVYLAGDGVWYPRLDRDLVEFSLEAKATAGWHLIAPGSGTSRDAAGVARWDSHGPVDEITLVGGPLRRFADSAGPVETLVYLREDDGALAAKYLQATAQYLEMYRGLIGPYPYGKFALVENFWETGYGMPSFTLLGSEVIRFPFILTSSYPHEILHNWWGNSVFVDPDGGNWSEGLTAYLADHLLQEQRGQGDAYRRDALQRYRSYVHQGGDFPLSEFRSRHSAATEAVGYGKTMMLVHMLRQRLGDEAFRRWAREFYREYRGRQASFADVRRTLEAVAGTDLGRFFADHVEKAGAAQLALAMGGVQETGGRFAVSFVLQQTQPGPPLLLFVPVLVQTAGKPVLAVVKSDAAANSSTLTVGERPLALQVDPAFDVFRLLDPREVPPSVGQIFGQPTVLAVLPSAASPAEVAGYRALVEGWRSEAHQPEIRTDAEVTALPKDRAVWILGRGNRLAPRLFASGADFAVDASRLVVARESMPTAGHSLVLVRRHPENPEQAVGWIAVDGTAALPGLGRKLPHYGKYSWLGFAGDEPTNVLKGQWTPTDSPLRVDLRPAGERLAALAPPLLPARKALAELPPVFSQKALMEHVGWLSAPEREGRGAGTRGLEAAAEYIAAAFKSAGLQPGGDGGTYFQAFVSPPAAGGAPIALRNVIGVLPGTRTEWAGQAALVSAHYDHLGDLHPGADDNASGVAVLLELARVLASGERPQRTIAFVAFSGEEAGRLGSLHYVAHPVFPLEKTIGVVNVDTVGRLFDKPVSVIAVGTADEWPHIFRGAGFVTGIEPRLIAEALASSDQQSFIERGVPAVQVFTGAHLDYHRPSDTADKLDPAGLVKVTSFVREAVAYLGERAQPLTNTTSVARTAISPNSIVRAGAPAGGRRVSFGTLPDFAYPGPGVKVAGVTPGSPAEKAGVREADVLLTIDGQPVDNLQGFATILRGLDPGQTVKVTLLRAGQTQQLEVTVVGR